MLKSDSKQWRLYYSEVKEMSVGCGDDGRRDFLLRVYLYIPLQSPSALCQAKGCHVVIAKTFP